MTGLTHYADYSDILENPNLAIKYTYDAFDRLVDEARAASTSGRSGTAQACWRRLTAATV